VTLRVSRRRSLGKNASLLYAKAHRFPRYPMERLHAILNMSRTVLMNCHLHDNLIILEFYWALAIMFWCSHGIPQVAIKMEGFNNRGVPGISCPTRSSRASPECQENKFLYSAVLRSCISNSASSCFRGVVPQLNHSVWLSANRCRAMSLLSE